MSNVQYFLRKFVEAAISIFVIGSLTFFLLRFMPGGPFDLEKALPDAVKAHIEAQYGLNRPLWDQFLNYWLGIFQGDLGQSYKYLVRSVTDMIAETLPVSFELGIYSLLLAYIVGIPFGILSASRHNSAWDYGLMFFAMLGVALPSFMIGPLLVQAFKGYFPVALWESPSHYVLPVVTLGLRPAALIARLTRSSALDVIHSDFIRTARAKGLSEKRVLFQHVLRNSMIPVLTFSGPLIAGILSGSFVVELIFAIPGMGKHLIQSVTNRDYPLVMGLTLLYASLLIICNLLVDIFYRVFDPRIKLS